MRVALRREDLGAQLGKRVYGKSEDSLRNVTRVGEFWPHKDKDFSTTSGLVFS